MPEDEDEDEDEARGAKAMATAKGAGVRPVPGAAMMDGAAGKPEKDVLDSVFGQTQAPPGGADLTEAAGGDGSTAASAHSRPHCTRRAVYELRSVLRHQGESPRHGHYICDAKGLPLGLGMEDLGVLLDGLVEQHNRNRAHNELQEEDVEELKELYGMALVKMLTDEQWRRWDDSQVGDLPDHVLDDPRTRREAYILAYVLREG